MQKVSLGFGERGEHSGGVMSQTKTWEGASQRLSWDLSCGLAEKLARGAWSHTVQDIGGKVVTAQYKAILKASRRIT